MDKPIARTENEVKIFLASQNLQIHGLGPCDPDRLSRSGVPFVGIRSPFGESPDGQEEERMKNLLILMHIPGDRKREVVVRLSSIIGSTHGRIRTRINTRAGPNGVF